MQGTAACPPTLSAARGVACSLLSYNQCLSVFPCGLKRFCLFSPFTARHGPPLLAHVSVQREPVTVEPDRDQDADKRQDDRHCRPKPPGPTLRSRTDRDAPLTREVPHSIAQMERRGRYAHDIEREIQGMRHH